MYIYLVVDIWMLRVTYSRVWYDVVKHILRVFLQFCLHIVLYCRIYMKAKKFVCLAALILGVISRITKNIFVFDREIIEEGCRLFTINILQAQLETINRNIYTYIHWLIPNPTRLNELVQLVSCQVLYGRNPIKYKYFILRSMYLVSEGNHSMRKQ